MRQYGPQSPRTVPTDRNPSTVAQGADAGIAGGSTVILGTYTVPVGRRASVVASAEFNVTTALAAAQNAHIKVFVTPSGGAAQAIAGAMTSAAAPAGTERQTVAVQLQLKAGDLVTAQVALDAGAGVGTCKGGIQGVEYDV